MAVKQRTSMTSLFAEVAPEGYVFKDGDTATVPRKDIRAALAQPRTEFDMEKLKAHGARLKSDGILQPLVVRPYGPYEDGSYKGFEIIAGERRFRAAELAGIEMVPIRVRVVDSKEAFRLALRENEDRENLSISDLCAAAARLQKLFDYSVLEVAAEMGWSENETRNRLAAGNAPEALRDCLKLPFPTMSKVAKVARRVPPEKQGPYIRRIKAKIEEAEIDRLLELEYPSKQQLAAQKRREQEMLKLAASSHPTPLQQNQGTVPRPNYEPERTAPDTRNVAEEAEEAEPAPSDYAEAQNAAARASTPAEAAKMRAAAAHDKYLQQSGQGADVLSAPDAQEATLRAVESLIEQIRQRREDGATEDDVRPLWQKLVATGAEWA